MASTGFLIPTADSDSGAGQEFNNRVNARTDNSSNSTIGANATVNGSYWHTFGASVPTGATIDGFEIRLRGLDTFGDGGSYFNAQLSLDAGTTLGTVTRVPTGTTTLPSSGTKFTAGGATDKLGLTSITPAKVNAANFYIFIVAAATDGFQTEAGLELIEVNIYYTPSGGGGATGKSNPLSGPLGGPIAGILG